MTTKEIKKGEQAERLRSIEVHEPWQVELMRLIYNDNLDMLGTRPLPHRTYGEQQVWWNGNRQHLKAFLYEPVDKPGKFVAFLVLRNRGGFSTPIIALQKEEWGSGYGQEIVRDYIRKADGPLAGTQLQSNKAICHINKKVGWQILGQADHGTGPVDLLFHPGVNEEMRATDEIMKRIYEYLGMK